MERLTLAELDNSTLSELLEEKLVFFQADKIADSIRLVFWKENEKWQVRCFCLEKDGSITLRSFKTLRWIESIDKHAVVIKKRDFTVEWTNTLIDIDRMVHIIERKYDETECRNNVSEFLKEHIKVQGLLEFNQEQFFQTELGKKLIDTINHFRAEMLTDDPHIERFQAIIDTIFLALKQFYHVDCKVVLRENGYDIVANNIEDLMCKCSNRNERSYNNE